MSRSDKRDRGALIALALALAAILLIAWLNQPPRSQIAQINANSPQAENDGGQPVAKRVYWGLFTADDTFAQWIMALFTIAATGVSLLAVKLVRDTLEENRKATGAAVKAAEAAEATVRGDRPWIMFNEHVTHTMFIGDGPRGFLIELKFVNAGKRPAIDIRMVVAHKLIREDEPIPSFQPNLKALDYVGDTAGSGMHAGVLRFTILDKNADLFKAHKRRCIAHAFIQYRDVNSLPSQYQYTEVVKEIIYDGERKRNDGEIVPHTISRNIGGQGRLT